ncbi:MAG: 50S ribosomal protein L9 [Desulfobulbaceae bacterium]|uniref:Large ribosomal subunit protein bL9 n=1 Tax=Candidatus Desulfatifera sulfidica TaxID=2841691 RepID=A0A8J6NCI3_9BACT|nr:50S ribosomal protein L9 [Candidatus Desulfatifera sulfidica]
MELILKETLDNLGQEGEIVKVKPGYGRNYLLPQGKAVMANAANRSIFERNQAAILARIEGKRIVAEQLAKKLTGITITINQLAGTDERLFGSVTSADLSEKLAELNIVVDRKNILLTDPIKTLGDFTVPVKVGFQMTTDIQVSVTPLTQEA